MNAPATMPRTRERCTYQWLCNSATRCANVISPNGSTPLRSVMLPNTTNNQPIIVIERGRFSTPRKLAHAFSSVKEGAATQSEQSHTAAACKDEPQRNPTCRNHDLIRLNGPRSCALLIRQCFRVSDCTLQTQTIRFERLNLGQHTISFD